MTRRTRLNTALAVIAIVLAGGLWLSRPKPPAPPQPLLHLARQDITRIEIRPAGAGTIVLDKQQGHWRLLQPVKARASANAVDSLLDIASLTPQRRLADGEVSTKQTGLDKPAVTLEFNNGPTLAIGAYLPLNSGPSARYVRSGNTIALAAIPHAGLLDMPWSQWVNPHVLAANAQLETLHLPEFTLERSATGGWRVSPANRDRGADAAQFTVDTWRRATALSVTPAQDQPALASVRLVFADGHARQLDVTARQPQLILRDPQLGIAYHLAGDMASALLSMRHPALDDPTAGAAKPRQRPSRTDRTQNLRSR